MLTFIFDGIIRMVKWAVLIFILIILLYFSSRSISSIFEGFTTDQETNYEKALDRANPLAANENSSSNKIPIGISKGNGIIQRLMHQTALNIPTSVVSENGVWLTDQVPPQFLKL